MPKYDRRALPAKLKDNLPGLATGLAAIIDECLKLPIESNGILSMAADVALLNLPALAEIEKRCIALLEPMPDEDTDAISRLLSNLAKRQSKEPIRSSHILAEYRYD
jgi:hypothetical protein